MSPVCARHRPRACGVASPPGTKAAPVPGGRGRRARFVPARSPAHPCMRAQRAGASRRSAKGGDPRPVPGFPGRLPAAGAPPGCTARTTAPSDEGEPVSSASYPRHARRSGVARWAGQMAEFGPIRPRPRRGGQAPRLGSSIRWSIRSRSPGTVSSVIRSASPAAWCEMPGCGAAFADPVKRVRKGPAGGQERVGAIRAEPQRPVPPSGDPGTSAASSARRSISSRSNVALATSAACSRSRR